MAKTKSQGRRKSHPTGGSAPEINIRMYRVGFGDCFLVTLAGKYHILVDCGVHNKGNIAVDGESLIDKAFHNIQSVTGGTLHLVIATHAHQDHVSGYGKFADEFRKFHVGEVWMPWTDDLNNSTARKWHKKKTALVGLLGSHFAATGDLEALAAVQNAEPNGAAMSALRDGFGSGKVRYLKAGDSAETPGGIQGFSARILGPPEDQSFISRMDPPGGDHYLRMVADTLEGGKVQPFASWQLKAKSLLPNWPKLDARVIAALKESTSFAARDVAFSLDKLLNNTSIVALFSWRGKHLLFPGDAQYGDWSSWYKKSGSEVLSDICFYKVAHHGSWYATPKGAVELMPEHGFAAMMSTQSVPWPSIPREGLMEGLTERTGGRVARSDSIPVPGKAPQGPALKLGKDFKPGQYSQGEFWIDCTIA